MNSRPTYILIAEGGGWPDHAIGSFENDKEAQLYIDAAPSYLRKFLESWSAISYDIRDLTPEEPDWSAHYVDICETCYGRGQLLVDGHEDQWTSCTDCDGHGRRSLLRDIPKNSYTPTMFWD